eukprot:TRINITY_DN3994_c0_g2_i1.p2 TRINITY_DN3994_c0_g2~~TRINITY_DN3994_c0_g2_i1.p2  ORF type:complete len:240 (+),score=41.32 TRINITY_DN3994_c0_g2_i1:69-722(+)
MDKSRVDMVRVPQVLVKELDTQRDSASVFPLQAKQLSKQKFEQAYQAKRFVSEKQLTEDKDSQDLNQDSKEEDPVISSKPLAQVLADQKAQKEEQFQQKWRIMKQGKNRPLEDEEVEFLEGLRIKNRQQLEMIADEEKNDLETFKRARSQLVAKEVVAKRPEKRAKVSSENLDAKTERFKLNCQAKQVDSTKCSQISNLIPEYGDSDEDSESDGSES